MIERIALCFYGQPRNVAGGYRNLSRFLRRFPKIDVDVFYHAWHRELQPGEADSYDAASWRDIPDAELRIENGVIDAINQYYRPVAHCVEPPRKFDEHSESLCFRNTEGEAFRTNASNVLSQFCSRTAVRNLLASTYPDAGNRYDMVIMTRFDYTTRLSIDLRALDPDKVYVSDMQLPRSILPDNFFVLGTEQFLKLFDIYDNLPQIVDNAALKAQLEALGEKFIFNPENLLLANYLFHFGNLDKVVYAHGIHDFPRPPLPVRVRKQLYYMKQRLLS